MDVFSVDLFSEYPLCCVHVRRINCLSCIFSIFMAWFYIRISVVNIFCLSSLLFMGLN